MKYQLVGCAAIFSTTSQASEMEVEYRRGSPGTSQIALEQV